MRSLVSELRRRKVLRAVALYVVAAWVFIQVLGEAFDAWGVADEVLRYAWIAAILGFPLALVFAWRFDIVGWRVVLTPAVAEGRPGEGSLQWLDYLLLAALALIVGAIVIGVGRQAAQAPDDRATSGEIDPKSVAVLPFENMSDNPANASFTAGIHDDILTQIAKVSDLKVISRTSVSRLDPGLHVTEIGALLEVAAILEGGVQRLGNQLRVNVQLVDAATDMHLWAETFDRELSTRNIFALQSEIARAVANSLQATLSPQEDRRLGHAPTDNLEAYESYLLGNHSMALRTIPSLTAARGYFARAIQLDPDYALAHVGLANAILLLSNYGDLPLQEAQDEVDALLARAIELDGQLAAAYAAKGHSLGRQRRVADAVLNYQRAIELDPNYAPAWHWYGDALLNGPGRLEEALQLLERARELDPLSPVIIVTLGEVLEGLGRLDDAMAAYRKAQTIEPDFSLAYFLIALHNRFAHGRIDEAVRWHRAEHATDPTRLTSFLGLAHLDLGDVANARRWLRYDMEHRPEQFGPLAGMALLHRYLDEEEQALDLARRLNEIAPFNNASLVTMVSFGRYEEVLSAFHRQYREFDCTELPIDRNTIFPAINVSLAMEKTGDSECAAHMLAAVLETLRTMPRLGARGFGIADVEIYARQGKKELALATLRQAIDEGWRGNWWAQGERSPHNASIADDPRFKAMMDEIRADMAKQLDNVRRWEENGELALP